MVERSSRWVTAGWLALLALVATLLQRVPPHPWDADTHYHLAVARLLGQHGILHSFPWTPFSWLADHYADKELVFHLLMVPFAGLDPSTASWLVGSLCGALLLFAVFEVLRREGVERPGLWTLAALGASGAFLLRFLAVRPHLLSIPLALLVTWSAATRRFWLLGLCAVAYPFTYIGWHLALVMVGLVELARVLVERRVEWRTGVVVLAGLGAGLLAHPNFPENLEFWRLVLMDVLVRTAWSSQAGFAQGTEFLPLGWEGLLRFGAVPLAATGWALVAARRRGSTAQVGFALAALALAVLTFRTQRFVEYWAPFSVVAAALATRGWRRPAAAGALGLAVAWTLLVGRGPVEQAAQRGEDVPPAIAEHLARAIPVGAQVFTCSWGLTGELMLALPERRFLVALDPVLFHRKDPERYREWFELVRRASPDAARTVRERFGARYVLCELDPTWRPFVESLERDPSVRPLLRGPLWYAAEVLPGGAVSTPP